jgi:hypothetical protein
LALLFRHPLANLLNRIMRSDFAGTRLAKAGGQVQPQSWLYRHKRKAEDWYNEDSNRPYEGWKPWAYWVKTRLQMLIAVYAIVVLALRIGLAIHPRWRDCGFGEEEVQRDLFCYPLPPINGAIRLVGDALAVAAVVELCYALFTPGPDEALDPLMLGLAAALLIGFSQTESLDPRSALAALIFSGALGVLFFIRRTFVSDRARPNPNAVAILADRFQRARRWLTRGRKRSQQ